MAYDDYLGKIEQRVDTVWPLLVRGLAATLDMPAPEDGILPPLWHWMLFQDWAPASQLGPDGHPRRGGFLPPVHDLPRRMWAGGRLRFERPLRVGERVERTSRIASIEEKTGRSGRLVFVTVEHRIEGPAGPALIEEHDIVYRTIEAAAAGGGEPADPAPADAVIREVLPDPVLLFRYSALTGNGHRIHYDLAYATGTELYPALVVHGPLQATWLADLALRARPGSRLRSFSFRGRRPAFHDSPLKLEAWGGDRLQLQTRDASGAVCMTAEAELA